MLAILASITFPEDTLIADLLIATQASAAAVVDESLKFKIHLVVSSILGIRKIQSLLRRKR